MAKFKVRRDALFMQSASFVGGASAASTMTIAGAACIGGALAMTGGITAPSTFTVTGSLITGTGGTAIAGILAGSGNIVMGALSASTASVTCFAVTGLTQAHKLFVTGSGLSGCITVACAYCTAAGGELVVGFINQSSEALGAGTSAVHYLAILDK